MSKKETLDSIKKISIFELKKKGYLKPIVFSVWGSMNWDINGYPSGRITFNLKLKDDNEYFSPYIRLMYKIKLPYESTWKIYDDKFELVKVPCPLGGFRWFFICGRCIDGKYCGRKVAILYMVDDRFLCRNCSGLSYDSCNEDKRYRCTFLSLSLGRAIEDHSKLKRHFYSGKPTRKHRKYLKKTKKYMRKAISMEKRRAIINKIFGV